MCKTNPARIINTTPDAGWSWELCVNTPFVQNDNLQEGNVHKITWVNVNLLHTLTHIAEIREIENFLIQDTESEYTAMPPIIVCHSLLKYLAFHSTFITQFLHKKAVRLFFLIPGLWTKTRAVSCFASKFPRPTDTGKQDAGQGGSLCLCCWYKKNTSPHFKSRK